LRVGRVALQFVGIDGLEPLTRRPPLSASDDDRIETALARTESDAEAASRAAAAVAREVKRARTAAAQGSVRDLQKALLSADQLAEALREAVRRLRSGWSFDERAHLESGAYTAELLAMAGERGVRLLEQDERILSYPSVVRVLPAEVALEVDRKRERRIRPSVVLDHLKALQQRQPRFKAEAFLESLARAYKLALAEQGRPPGATIRLLDVYQILTVLPGQRQEYSRQEFARDVYLLDQSESKVTREGLRVSFPAATGTRAAGTLSTVTREGELKVYYGIAFRE
jgi:hypothetical protein